MQIEEFFADDLSTVTAVVELYNAASRADAPWKHPVTAHGLQAEMRHGWDGEVARFFVGRVDHRVVASGQYSVSEWDNLHLAWLGVDVHPDLRRRGHGSMMLAHLVDIARAEGRTSLGIDAWESTAARAFAERHDFEKKSQAINRRMHVGEVPLPVIEELYAAALPAAAAYDLVRLAGHAPGDLMEAVSVLSASINDAPTDDLDVEDEVYPVERIRAYEDAQLADGRHRFYRVVARHRETGALAGHTVVVVEQERPQIGDQHDTTVVAAHRGHRLGLLLKAEMMRWLAQEEPKLATIDTWNAESNDHMIAVNERLGYRPMGRGLQFQRPT